MATKTESAKSISEGELQRLLDFLESFRRKSPNYLRNYLIVLFLGDAGLRVGELVQLLWSDVYHEGWCVDKLRVRAEIAKNNKERIVPLSKRLFECVQQYKRENSANLLDSNAVLFPTRDGICKPITIRSVQYMIRTAGKLALGIDLTPHMLRHTFATRVMKLADIRTVQELMGHTHVSSTQIYTHPSQDDLFNCIDKLNAPRNH